MKKFLRIVLIIFFSLVAATIFFRRVILTRKFILAKLPFFEKYNLTVKVCNPYIGNLDIVDSVYVDPQDPFTNRISCELQDLPDGCKKGEIDLLRGTYRLDAGGGYTGSETVSLSSDMHVRLNVFGPVLQ